jgi:hypothetical protein
VLLSLSIVVLCAGKAQAQTPASLQTITAPQGGKIVYGTVAGAATQAAAMSFVLRNVHNNCGEKPQVGQVFQFRGTNSVGVFFTVTNHPGGNKKVAGLVIANATGPKQVDAALLSDDASRFGQTVNPMLQQLFGVWHPDSQAAAGASGSSNGSVSAPAAPLRMVQFPDNSASVGIPDGWQLGGASAGGTGGVIKATNGHDLEIVQLGMTRGATAPNPYQRQGYGGANNYGNIVYPANVDLTRAFPAIFNQFWRLLNVSDTQLTVDHAEMMPAPPGQRCVHATGHAKVFPQTYAKTPGELNALLCTTMPGPMGNYAVVLYYSDLPVEFADRDRATAAAIMASFQPNQAVIAQQSSAMAAPAIAAIHAIGAQAAAQMKSTEAAHDAQNAAWNAGQANNARNGQAFSNYLLDQSVVQNNNVGGTGAVGHATVWNSTANALVQADPNRFEIVSSPNYWQGTDF